MEPAVSVPTVLHRLSRNCYIGSDLNIVKTTKNSRWKEVSRKYASDNFCNKRDFDQRLRSFHQVWLVSLHLYYTEFRQRSWKDDEGTYRKEEECGPTAHHDGVWVWLSVQVSMNRRSDIPRGRTTYTAYAPYRHMGFFTKFSLEM